MDMASDDIGGMQAVKTRINATKYTIEEQSQRVKGASQDLRNIIEGFMEGVEPVKGIPPPQLDTLAQISDNLQATEQALGVALKCFEQLKTRIRG